jgi:hypothetical protein
MSVRPWVQEGHARSEEVIYVAGHDAEVVQDRRRRDEQVRLREGVMHGLSLFHDATPDHDARSETHPCPHRAAGLKTKAVARLRARP